MRSAHPSIDSPRDTSPRLWYLLGVALVTTGPLITGISMLTVGRTLQPAGSSEPLSSAYVEEGEAAERFRIDSHGPGGFHILTCGLAPVMGGPGLDDGIEVAH